MKFGIWAPSSAQEALGLDRENRYTCWQDANSKEMHNNRIAFEVLDE